MSTEGRRPSTPEKGILFIIAVLVLAALTVNGSPWATQVVSGPRVLLNCPSFLSLEATRSLLEDRERALAFAEEVLGGQLFRRLIVTIEPTLLTSAASAEHTDGGGAITFRIPVPALERFESDGISPFDFAGCHEEVHAVANHLWLGNEYGTLATLREGVAVYVEELRRGTAQHHAIAGTLHASGQLDDLDHLLGTRPVDDPAEIIQLNTYYGGASFVEFVIDRYGMERLSELYGVEWMRWDIRNPDDGFIQAAPGDEILRICGKTLTVVNAEWQTWVAAHSTGSPADAEIFLQAYTSDITVLKTAIAELEEYWNTSPFHLVGPSSLAVELCEAVTNAVFRLASLRGAVLAEAYAIFCDRLDRMNGLLAAWLGAIHAFEEALERTRSDVDPAEFIDLLEAAEAGYALVDDEYMARQAAARLSELRGEPSG